MKRNSFALRQERGVSTNAPRRGKSAGPVVARSALGFPAIRLARAFHGGRERFLLPRGYILAALDQFVGAIAQLAGFALGEFAAFIGLLAEKLAGFLSGLGSEEDADQGAHAEANQKISDFGTNVVRHKSLQQDASIGVCVAQYKLTSMYVQKGYEQHQADFAAPRCARIFSALARETTRLKPSIPARFMCATLPNSLSSFWTVRGPTPGISLSTVSRWRLARRWRWKVKAKRCVSSRICWIRCSTGEWRSRMQGSFSCP